MNVAQRLESAAPPGAILVSDAVRAAAAGRAAFRDAGELALKGRREPVRAHVATAEEPGSSESVILEAAGGALFGRSEDIESLEAAWRAGSGRLLVVEGEAGIGKSRQLAELRRRARASGGLVLAGRALQEARLPLSALAEIGRRVGGPDGAAWFAAAMGEGPVAARRGDVIALSLGLPLPPERRAAIAGAAALSETVPAWEAWFAARAARQRVLLCLEDLHWAGPGTVELAARLAAAAPAGRALVVASTRPCGHAFPGETRLLRELDPPAVRSVAEAVLREPVSDALAAFLARQTGGNPYYAAELARHLRRHGLLAGRPLGLSTTPDRIPDSLLGVLVARIDAQSAACHEALKAAAVLGRVFWPALLPPATASGVEEARDAGLVLASPDSVLHGEPALQFRHALLRDAAYGLLTKRDRAASHSAAAAALEATAARAGRAALTLAAGHREEAGELDEAARLHARVSEESVLENAREALTAGQNAVRLRDSATARLHIGFAHFILGEIEPAEREALAAREFPGATDDERARASVVLANVTYQRGDFEEALRHATEGIPAGKGVEMELQRRALRCRALVALGRVEEGLRETMETRDDEPGDRGTRVARAFVLGERGGTLMRLLRFEEALAAHRRAREIHIETGNPLGVSTSANNVAGALVRLGRVEEALLGLESALESARKLGAPHGLAVVLSNLGALLNHQGRWREAEERLREALAIREEMGGPVGVGGIAVNLGRSLAGQGRLAESAAVLERGRARCAGLQDSFSGLRLTVQLAALQMDRADPSVESLLAEAERGFAADPAFAAEPAGRNLLLVLQVVRALHEARSGRPAAALARLAEHLPALEGTDAALDIVGARILMAGLDPERTAEHLERAVETARLCGNGQLLARALAARAAWRARQGRREDASTDLAESLRTPASPGTPAVEAIRCLREQAAAHEALGEAAEAAALRAKLDALVAATGAHGA
ncbi:MAG: tetratricopeptide repeat protein [Planctomycetia bacterium]|nr:tetratricopeptide repeat protein [Planctomycetia bacterium]